MICSLFACRLSAVEAFPFLSGGLCWVFSNAHKKKEHLLVFFFFVTNNQRSAGVTPRRRPLVDCTTQPRPLSKLQKTKPKGLHNLPARLKIFISVHGELFTGRTVRLAVKLSQGCRASEQWLVMQKICEDSFRMLLIIESLT